MTELSALGLVLAGLTTFGEPFTHLRRWSSAINSAVSFKNAFRFFFKDNNTGHHKPLFDFQQSHFLNTVASLLKLFDTNRGQVVNPNQCRINARVKGDDFVVPFVKH